MTAVRVLEMPDAGIAVAYAGFLLAGLGAEVTRLVAAEPSLSTDPIALSLSALAAGKLDEAVPTDAAAFATRVQTVDILLCDDLATLEQICGPLAGLRVQAPRVVFGIASTFGLDGPYSKFAGTGLDAQALSGVAWALGDPSREPLSLPPGIVDHQGGAMLAAGCLLALDVRDQHGSGRVVDIALADVLASYVAGNCRFYIHHGMEWHRSGRRASASGGAYPYVILPCKDGEVCLCGRSRDEWQRLVHVMGDPKWANDPRYQNLRAMGREYPDEVDALLRPWLAEHTMDQLESLALANNLIVSPVRDFASVIATPDFTAKGFLRPAQLAGADVLVPGLPFRVVEKRSADAPDIAPGLLRSAVPANDRASASIDQPLKGLRVLDFGWVWSAPWVGTMLGELGAEVIKVEHSKRLDTMRLSGKIFRDGKLVEGSSKEMSPMFHQVNHGKLGITMNAKEPRAVELLLELVAQSDLVIENMSPGSMERSGLGYETLRQANPKIVMLAMSAAGQFGGLSGMRAYAPTMSSFAGMEALVGYPGEEPIGALNFGLGDPNASAHALVAVMAALRRVRSTGAGCYIDLSQVEALLGTLRPYLLESQVTGQQTLPMGNRHPLMAPHGIYPAQGVDKWLSVVAGSDEQWTALAGLAGIVGDKRYATLQGRLEAVADLDADLARWTAEQPRDELVDRLRAAGIASSPVLTVEEMWQDPNYAFRQVKQPIEIAGYGSEDVFRAPWRFSDFGARIDRSGPSLGQHNHYVLGELLGVASAEIDAMTANGIVS